MKAILPYSRLITWASSRRCFNSSSLLKLQNEGSDLWLDQLDPEPTEEEENFSRKNYKIIKLEGTDSLPGRKEVLEDVLNYRNLGEDELGYSKKLISLKDYFLGNDHHTHNVFNGYSRYKQGRKSEQRTFVDLKLMRLKSGKGGNGAVSFFRDAFRPVGPPDGGDGGQGGNIYIQVVDNLTSLHKIRRSYEAKNGSSGAGKQLDGKTGEDIIIEVPVGTTIRWIPDPLELRKYLKENQQDLLEINLELSTQDKDIQLLRQSFKPGFGWIFKERDEEYHRERDYFNELNERVKEFDKEIIDEEIFEDRFPILGIDFDKPTTKPFLLLKGGKGGMGNMHFLTNDIRNPRFSKRGREGLTEFFLLELKLIADLGLVGLPNAGKSTLLRAISKARPRVGHWEFTTLQPTVGTIFTTIDKDPFTVADIPGIIKGASDNKGMGLDFLRHVERSGGLVFVVSLESKNVVDDLNILIDEVGPKRMKDKKVLVVATKADLTESNESYEPLKNFVESKSWKVIPVCAIKGHNIEKCIKMMSEIARTRVKLEFI